ncbi:MAG: hypothetical protein ACK4ZW_08440 [Blastomonas sp.]
MPVPDQTPMDEAGIVSPDRVRTVVQGLLRAAQLSGWTDDALSAASGIKARRIKSYRVEDKEPSLSAALSLAVAIGPNAINGVLALINYGGAKPLEGDDELSPIMTVASLMDGMNTITQAAADNRIDHVEKPGVQAAADAMIAKLVPLSSAGAA